MDCWSGSAPVPSEHTFCGNWTPPVSCEAVKLLLDHKRGHAGRLWILFDIIQPCGQQDCYIKDQNLIQSETNTLHDGSY